MINYNNWTGDSNERVSRPEFARVFLHGRILYILFALAFVATVFAALLASSKPAQAYWGGTLSDGCGDRCPSAGAVCSYWGNFYDACLGLRGPIYGIGGGVTGEKFDVVSDGAVMHLVATIGCDPEQYVNATASEGCSNIKPPAPKQIGCTCRDNGSGGAPSPNNSGTASRGDPVNVVNGNKYEVVTDFRTVGQNPLSFTRYYNSMAQGNTLLGSGWQSNFDVTIILPFPASTTASVYVLQPDGASYNFAKVAGVWRSANKDVSGTLTTDGATVWTYTDRNDTVETFDFTTGRLLSMKYRSGYQQTLTYMGDSLSQVSDSYGRTLSFTMADGVIQTMTDPDGKVFSYHYDTSPTGLNQRLLEVDYPAASGMPNVQYKYENDDFPMALTGIVDEAGNRFATWTYNGDGRVVESALAGGADNTTFAYSLDSSNLGTVTVTGPLNKQTIYTIGLVASVGKITAIDDQASPNSPASNVTLTYDANGYVSSRTDQNGNQSLFTNDSRGQTTSETDASGSSVARTITTTWDTTFHLPTEVVQPNITTDYTYDTNGRLIQRKLTDTTTTTIPYSTNGEVRTWDFTYYTSGLLHTVDGPLAGSADTTTYAYDASGCANSVTDVLGHTTTIGSSNGWCEPLSSLDANGITTNYGYDFRGRLTSATVNPGANQAVYGFAYDPVGNLTVITLPDSSTLTYAYDNAHRLTSITNTAGEQIVYTLDAMGNKTKIDVKTSGGTIKRTQTATFDELGRMLSSIGAASQTTQYSYDKDNNQISLTDPRSKVYGFAFDALNRLYQQTDPDTYQTTSAFNPQDDVTSVMDARSLQTSYVRDGFGEIIRQTSPDTGITDFWYDANGAVVKQIDARGVETDFTNDNLGRVLTKTFPAASAENVTYGYDSTSSGNKGVGFLTSMTDQSGSKAFSINALGQTTSQTDVVGLNSYATGYTYDVAGNILTETYPSGRIVTYRRDTVGRITGVTTKQNSGASAVNVATGVTHMPFGPISGFTFGNGAVLALAYDQDYQLTGINTANGGTVIQDLSYGYDPAGNITGITDNHTSARSQTLTYDNLNRVATANGAYGAQSYTYDGVGNRLTRVLGAVTDTYAYSPTANQISTITTGTNVRSFSYAATGQVTSDTRNPANTYAFTINDDGRNANAALNGSTVGTYLYDGFEQRAQKVAGGATIQFTYDLAGHLIAESNASGVVQREYIWIDDLPVAMVDATGASPVLYFVHTDQIGTPQKITDASSNLVWDGVFDPFGIGDSVLGANWGSVSWGAFNWGGAGSFLNPLRFLGQYADEKSALSQNWFRDYDSSVGRYFQSDPVGLTGGVNTYDYVNSNPLTLFDMDGLSPTGGMTPIPGEIKGGPWSPASGQRPGTFYGPKQPKGPRTQLNWVPPEGKGGPPGSEGYWKTTSPIGEICRYDQAGNKITAEQAHPNPLPANPVLNLLRMTSPIGAFLGILLWSEPAQ